MRCRGTKPSPRLCRSVAVPGLALLDVSVAGMGCCCCCCWRWRGRNFHFADSRGLGPRQSPGRRPHRAAALRGAATRSYFYSGLGDAAAAGPQFLRSVVGIDPFSLMSFFLPILPQLLKIHLKKIFKNPWLGLRNPDPRLLFMLRMNESVLCPVPCKSVGQGGDHRQDVAVTP